MKTLFAFSALLLSATPVMAQTAEETVAFMVGGLEDQKIVEDGGVTGTIELVSEIPAVYRVPTSRGTITVQVLQINQCQYQLDIDAPDNDIAVRLDFLRASRPTFTQDGKDVIVEQSGLKCEAVKGMDKCDRTGRDKIQDVSVERIRMAYAYFADKFCKPRAF